MDTPPKKKSHYTILAFLPVLAVASFLVLLIYLGEKSPEAYQFSDEETQKPGYVQIFARAMSVDPIKGEMTVRLQFDPNGNLAGEDGISLAQGIVMDIDSASGKSRVTFPKGDRMNPHDTVLDLDGGFWEYPFDTHEAYLTLYMAGLTSEADKAGISAEAIPITVNYVGDVGGYAMSAKEVETDTGYNNINISVSRSTSVVAFAVLIMVLQWLLALCAFGVMVVWTRGRQFEVTMFGWMGALLFALIPLRNAMPSVPPVGVLSDFLSFYWSLIVITLSMVASIVTWLQRGSAGRPK